MNKAQCLRAARAQFARHGWRTYAEALDVVIMGGFERAWRQGVNAATFHAMTRQFLTGQDFIWAAEATGAERAQWVAYALRRLADEDPQRPS
jgi:hypothetical protein